MKNFIITLLIIVFSFYGCSKIERPAQKFEILKLEILCKVWGFLKYYHPAVGAGEINWDLVLINNLKKTSSIKNFKELKKAVNELILSCEYDFHLKIDTPRLNGNFYKEISFDWLKDTTFISKQDIEILQNLLTKKVPYKNQFVSQDINVGNLFFDNEQPYADSIFPSKNY